MFVNKIVIDWFRVHTYEAIHNKISYNKKIKRGQIAAHFIVFQYIMQTMGTGAGTSTPNTRICRVEKRNNFKYPNDGEAMFGGMILNF